MNNALSVRFTDCVTYLSSPLHCLANGERPIAAEDMTQAIAFHVLHGYRDNSANAIEVVNSADILVRDFAGQAQLIPKTVNKVVLRGDFWFQNLQGNDLICLAVPGLVNNAHAALAQFRQQVKALA